MIAIELLVILLYGWAMFMIGRYTVTAQSESRGGKARVAKTSDTDPRQQ